MGLKLFEGTLTFMDLKGREKLGSGRTVCVVSWKQASESFQKAVSDGIRYIREI